MKGGWRGAEVSGVCALCCFQLLRNKKKKEGVGVNILAHLMRRLGEDGLSVSSNEGRSISPQSLSTVHSSLASELQSYTASSATSGPSALVYRRISPRTPLWGSPFKGKKGGLGSPKKKKKKSASLPTLCCTPSRYPTPTAAACNYVQ